MSYCKSIKIRRLIVKPVVVDYSAEIEMKSCVLFRYSDHIEVKSLFNSWFTLKKKAIQQKNCPFALSMEKQNNISQIDKVITINPLLNNWINNNELQ